MDYVLMGQKDARRLGMVQAALQGGITNQEGADALGISRRHFRRLRRRVKREGAKGLVHRSRGRPSARRLAESLRNKVVALLTQTTARLNDCHIADLLGEQGLRLSPDSVRRIRLSLSLPAKRRRRPVQHRHRREREERSGAMVLIDGSPFAWLKDGDPFTLMGGIDDATGAIVGLTFRPGEDLHGYALVLQQMAAQHGLPLALYGDRINILVRNDRHWTIEEELRGRQDPTQLGHALEELGIRYIAAHSPQAKGRVERLWATLQDRLTAELRLRHIRTLDQACAYLPSFVTRFNQRFARPSTASAWRRPPADLDRALACRYSRVVTRDNVVSIPGRYVQIPPGPHRRSYHRCRVEVRELLDGRLLVFSQGRLLVEQPAPPGAFILCPRPSHRASLMSPAERPKTTRSRPKAEPRPQPSSLRPPQPQHPWKKRLPIPLQRSRV
jgi:transposase